MKPEELINWGAWSRLLAGSRQTVRRNSIPKKHIPITRELIEAIQSVIDKIEPKFDAVSQNEVMVLKYKIGRD